MHNQTAHPLFSDLWPVIDITAGDTHPFMPDPEPSSVLRPETIAKCKAYAQKCAAEYREKMRGKLRHCPRCGFLGPDNKQCEVCKL